MFIALSSCGGQGGLGLARDACGHVKRSIAAYQIATANPNAPGAGAARATAIEQLETALPLAAQATSANPEWNPLMTTLQESGRIDERYLLSALRAQCALADSANPQAPVVPSTVPGQPTVPTPSTLPGQ